MLTSRLTSKAQTTLPRAVRQALGVGPGDVVAYAVEPGRVVLTRVARAPEAREDPFATFTEWDGDADRRAYGTL